MRKFIGIWFLIISLQIFANNQGAVIDREITGINKEQLENGYKTRDVKLENKQMDMPRASIPMDNYKLQREQLRLEKHKDEILKYEAITKSERKNPVWKYVLGTLLILTVGASVASSSN